MADSQALEKLRDIHLPSLIPWQLAPGWYLLILLALLLVVALCYWLRKRYFAQPSVQQLALTLLMEYQKEYFEAGDAQSLSIKISALLRRVSLHYFPRQDVAGLQGKQWIDFLNKTGKDVNFNLPQDVLLQLPYQLKQADQSVDLLPLIQSAETWIKQRGIPHV